MPGRAFAIFRFGLAADLVAASDVFAAVRGASETAASRLESVTFIWAKASRGLLRTASAAAAIAGGSAFAIVTGDGIELSITIRSGHFRSDLMRTGGRSDAAVKFVGSGTLGSTASARISSANKVPPTNRK
ncbi:hypothetical protein BRAS3809_2460001 [Bradyrhizobium sp. STM 3809]|nr:hypothetical protein BRAS3809_2460001 [Bradyrhizobium sp. STM 3809]